MSLDKKRDELAKLLTCLLVSRKGTCNIKELERDYYETEGRVIPFREFGFHSILDFLRSISNHVTLRSQSGGEYLVYPVVSDKIKHVNDLVIRQKSSKKSTPAHRKQSRPSRYYPPVCEPKSFIPNEVQKKVAQILVQNPSGVDSSSIAQCLQNSNAIARPVDHTNVNDYINGVPHIAFANGSCVYPSRSLVATIDAEQSKKQATNGHGPVIPDVSKIPEPSPRNNNACLNRAYPGGSEEGGGIYDDEDFYDEFADEDFLLESSAGSDHAVNDYYQPEGFSRTHDENRSKLSSAEFIERVRYQEPQSQNHEFENRDMAESHNDIEAGVNGVGNNEGDYEREYIYSSEDEAVSIISSRLQLRLEQLIKNHPDGIWCANLLQVFLDEYKVPLDYAELGFASVCELAASLRKIFQLHRWNDRGDFMLYHASQPLPSSLNEPKLHSPTPVWEDESNDDDDVEPFPMTVALQVTEKLIPNDVMTLGESVGQERIPEITAAEDCIEVYVADVYTPSLFWVHLRKKRAKLRQLMNVMHEFYQTNEYKYMIPHVILEKGLNCVCMFEDTWHRAIIKTVKPDGDVTLIFYDFGTTKTYPPDCVRYLHRKFSNLPAQSIVCGLYNVKPINSDTWTRGASLEFWTKVMNLPLMAMVVNIDRENNSMLVSLTDTQYEEDFHMNDWMVCQGLAEYGSMVRRRPSNFVFKHYLACTNYHYKKVSEAVKKNKVSRRVNFRVDLPESQRSIIPEEKLKSVNYLKNLMSKYSKYRKESNASVSSETKTINRQPDLTREHISTCVSGGSSKNLPAFETISPFPETISENRSSNICKLTRDSTSPKKIDTPNKSEFLSTYEQRETKKIIHSDESGSSSSQFVQQSTKVSDKEKPDDTSKMTNEDFVEGEVSSGRLEYSGTFRSFFGGHDHLNPIDWSKLRDDVQLGRESVSPKANAESRAIDESSSFNLSQENAKEPELYQYRQGCSNEWSNESSCPREIPNLSEVINPSIVKSLANQILPAKDCFLNAVKCNKDNYYSVHGKKLWWSPEGNIQNRPGVITPLLKIRKKSIKESGIDSMKVYASPEILQILRGENSQDKISDPELEFLIKLKKKDDHHNTEISNYKLASNVSNSSQDVTTSFQNTKVDSGIPNSSSKNRFAAILSYMNRKKRAASVTLIPTQNSSSVQHSSTSTDTQSVEAPDTSSSNLNLSDSSLSSSRILNSQKDEATLHDRELNFIKKPEQVSNSIQTRPCSSIHDTSSTGSSISSKNIDVVVESDKLSEHKSSTVVSVVDKRPEKRNATPEDEQGRASLLNITTVQCTSTEINFSNDTSYNKAGTQFFDLPELSDNVFSKTQEEIATSTSPCTLQSEILNLKSDNVSELDSDDLSHSDSALESEIMQTAPNKTIVYSTDNIEPKSLDVVNASVIPQDSSLVDERKDNRDHLTSSNESVSSINDKQIETRVSKIAPNNVKVFNDLELMSDMSDEWDVNWELADFVKDKFIDELEATNNASKLAICDQNNDNFEVDDVPDRTDLGNEQINEEVYDNKFLEIRDMIDCENSESYDCTSQNSGDVEPANIMETIDCDKLTDISSSENSRKDSAESDGISMLMDKTSLTDIAADPNFTASNKSTSSKISAVVLRSEENIISNKEINNLGNDAKVTIENESHGAVETSKNNLPSVTMSKTKSIRDMLENFKLKINSKCTNNDVEKVESNINVSTSAELQFRENFKSDITSSGDSEKSGGLSAKELFSESEMLADLSNTSSSSRCSLNVISSDMVGSESHSAQRMTGHKNHRYSQKQHNASVKLSETSSSDSVEFVEEQPETPKQLSMSILSRIKMEQLSPKSPNTITQFDVAIMSKRDGILLNSSSSGSSNGSSTPLLDKIKQHIYSNEN